jgi:hypothetical protein
MAAATPTTHDAIIKHVYPDPSEVQRAMYENNTAYALLKKDYSGSGKAWHLPIRIAHTAGRSHRFDIAKRNKAGTKVVELAITTGSNYSLYSVDGKLIRETRDNKGAFVEAFEFELEGAMDAMARNFGYDVYGNGGGSIGRFTSGVTLSGTTFTLLNIDDVVKFEKGQFLELSATDGTSGTVKAGQIEVSAVDRDTGVVTTVAAINAGVATAAASDYIFPAGDFGAGVKGFDAWIPASAPTAGDSFFGLDRSQDPTRLAGSRVAGAGLSPEEQLQKACQVAMRNGGKLTHFFWNDANFLDLVLSLGTRKEYADTKTDVGVSFTGVRVYTGMGTVEVYADYNCPKDVAYGVDLKQWSLKGLGQFPFIDATDGSRVLREDAADAYEGRIKAYYQMQCKKIAGSVRLALV